MVAKARIRQVAMPEGGKQERGHWLDITKAVLTAYENGKAIEIDAEGIDAHAMRSAVGQQLIRRGLLLRTQRRGDTYVLWAVRDDTAGKSKK